MHMNPQLQELIARCEPLWGAEALVFRTYWDWSGRTRATDRLWLTRQIYKELNDGVVAQLDKLVPGVRLLRSHEDQEGFRAELEVVRQEFEHYAIFADLYVSLNGGEDEFPGFELLMRDGTWPENSALMEMRALHCDTHGEIGERARCFTEGGYCTIFSEGMKLESRAGFDREIAVACARIFPDELEHMLRGIAEFIDGSDNITEPQWRILASLVTEQLRQRVRMRNAQFSCPIGEDDMSAILGGACAPVTFDYERAVQMVGNAGDGHRGR